MGVNNKQRRVAKKKKARARSESAPALGATRAATAPELTAAEVRALLLDVVEAIWDDAAAARRCAGMLVQPVQPLTADIVRSAVQSYLHDLMRRAITGGWSPSDLVEITRRRASEAHVPFVAALLHKHTATFPTERVCEAWREDVGRAGQGRALLLDTVGGMQIALELQATLAQLPSVPPVLSAPGTAAPSRRTSAMDDKLLTKVQALLAKAEATEYDEEAEAFSAKAQELISRHSLGRLLDQAARGQADEAPEVRRLWLDAPYVFPKAMLVHVVAEANRCRSVVAEQLGFCTLLGAVGDLDAVGVLVPSLLVQAHIAMARHGRQIDLSGTSRTRSFRQAFLLSYAQRVGERLRSADEQVVAGNHRGSELVPVLAHQREQIDAACKQLFPRTVPKGATASNAQGWWAGRVAADQARIGPDHQIPSPENERAAS